MEAANAKVVALVDHASSVCALLCSHLQNQLPLSGIYFGRCLTTKPKVVMPVQTTVEGYV